MAEVVRSFDVPTDPAAALRDAGWVVTERGGALEAMQGSQWRTRLLGGWFVSVDALPKRIDASKVASGAMYEVTVSSAFGFGYVDRRLRRRYEGAFDDLEVLLSHP